MANLYNIPVSSSRSAPGHLLKSSLIQPEDQAQLREALQQETKIELEKKGNGTIAADDLISPSKKLVALGTLYSSLVIVSPPNSPLCHC